MSKFYVQSGSVRVVLAAETRELASISAIDSVMSPHLWIYNDSSMSDDIRRDHLMVEALWHLDAVVSVSEKGFDREDATILGTPEIVEEWHLLMSRLSGLYVAAGLPPRPLSMSGSGTFSSLAS